MDFDLDLQGLAGELKKRHARRVLVQVPEGLKTRAMEIARELERRVPCEVLLSTEPSFGACDLREEDASRVGADTFVHFGHAPMGAVQKSTLFWPVTYKVDAQKLAALIAKTCQSKRFKTIALAANANFAPNVPALQKALQKKGVKAVTGTGDLRVLRSGNVIGCNYSAVHVVEAKCDAVFFVGDGFFHPLGLAASAKKPVFAADPREMKIIDMAPHAEKMYRQRMAAIARAHRAKTFGILVSTKKGQFQLALAKKAKGLLEKHGKKGVVMVMDFVSEDKLLGVDVDAYVIAACPRIAEDTALFKKPLLTFTELEVLLGERKEWKFEEIEWAVR